MNAKRIQKVIKASYAKARAALAEARESGSEFSTRVALETFKECRKLNRDRRRALALGQPV